jgi:hypothetical protein
MKLLLAIMFGCALLLGLNAMEGHSMNASAGSDRGDRSAPAALQLAPVPEAGDLNAVDDEGVVTDGEAYECRYSPYCQRASQCTAYCAGGAPVCFQGCCSCAS